VNGQLYPYVSLLGKLIGVSLLGISRKKENVYLGSFSRNQKTFKVKTGDYLILW
jgi:hypothetical protein